MVAVTVTFDGTRLHTADAAGNSTDPTAANWTDLGAGKAATEPDFIYQGGGAVSEKVGTSEGGVAADFTATVDYTTPKVWIVKHIATNSSALNSKGATGGILEIGSGGIRSAYDRYYVVGGDTYPIKGGWLITPIDPNGTPSATPGTAPTLTAIDYYGWACTFGATSKAENVALDAIDHIDNGTGLTLENGSGGDADGVFQDFIDEDEGTSANRWGIVTTQEGVLYVVGVLTIGSATETDFSDSNQVLVFPDAEFLNSVGFYGIDISIENASSIIQIDSCLFKGRGSTAGAVDTRPDYSVIGGAGTVGFDSCTFDVFRQMELTEGATLLDCTVLNGNSINNASGVIAGCIFDGSTAASGTALLLTNDPQPISGCTFNHTLGHAIEMTVPGTYNFYGNNFNDFWVDGSGDAAIYNNSGGAITLNILQGDTPTVRNGASATTTLNNAVTLSVHVTDEGGNDIVGARVAIFTDPGGTQLMNEDTVGGGLATESYNYTGDQAITVRVRESPNAASGRYFPFFGSGTITNNGFTIDVILGGDGIATVV